MTPGRKERIFLILLLLVLSVAAGCAKPIVVNAFDGDYRADAEVATLRIDTNIRLVSLDGQPVAGLPAGLTEADSTAPRVVRLLPGTHEVVAGIRPRLEVHSYPIYTPVYCPSGGDPCHGGGGGHFTYMVTGQQTTTTHVEGSRENERLQFTVSPGRQYRLALDDPFDWFSRRQRWSTRVIEKTNAWRDPTISTSLGREAHITPPPQAQFAKASGG